LFTERFLLPEQQDNHHPVIRDRTAQRDLSRKSDTVPGAGSSTIVINAGRVEIVTPHQGPDRGGILQIHSWQPFA
jgi:hypothetical protein